MHVFIFLYSLFLYSLHKNSNTKISYFHNSIKGANRKREEFTIHFYKNIIQNSIYFYTLHIVQNICILFNSIFCAFFNYLCVFLHQTQ